MNVRAAQPPRIPAQGSTRPGFDVTVADDGVQQHSQAAPKMVTPPKVAAATSVRTVEPTSTPELSATLSIEEKGALAERFSTLPEQGLTGSGVYDPRGRTATLPAAQHGRLLDITG